MNTKTKEMATAKANANLFAEMMNRFNANTAGLVKTSLGTKKASIYKEDMFADKDDSEKKKMRKKIRNMMLALCNSIVMSSGEDRKKLLTAFNDFYKSTYKVNDYSLGSVCSENLDLNKKKILEQALSICKTANKK